MEIFLGPAFLATTLVLDFGVFFGLEIFGSLVFGTAFFLGFTGVITRLGKIFFLGLILTGTTFLVLFLGTPYFLGNRAFLSSFFVLGFFGRARAVTWLCAVLCGTSSVAARVVVIGVRPGGPSSTSGGAPGSAEPVGTLPVRISEEVVMKLWVEEAIEDVMVPGMVGKMVVGMLVPGMVEMVVPAIVGMVVPGMLGWLVPGMVGMVVPRMVGWLGAGMVGWLGAGMVGMVVPGMVGWLVPGMMGWLVPGMVGWLGPGMVGWLVPGMVGWLVPVMVGWLVPGMVGWLVPGMVGMVVAIGGRRVVSRLELMLAEVTGATEAVAEASGRGVWVLVRVLEVEDGVGDMGVVVVVVVVMVVEVLRTTSGLLVGWPRGVTVGG